METKSRQTKAIHNAMDADPFVMKTFSTEVRNQTIDSAETAADLAKLQKDGFVIIEKLLSPSQVQEVREALAPHLGQTGRNNFEGTRTQRVYGLLGISRAFDFVATHPRIMAILDKLLLPNPLITAYQAINILPGETAQPFHHDDQFVPMPRPHPSLSIATVWAIDDFGADNGATQVIPGSHLWGDRLPTPEDKSIPAVMPSGSVVVFQSTLWHGGGPNTSDRQRLAVSAQYCEPYVRPQENQFLVVPPAVIPTLSPRLQSLIGYSIHPPFIGHVNGIHPLKALPNPWKEQNNANSQQAKL